MSKDNLFDEEAFRGRVTDAVRGAGGGVNAARLSKLSESTISRILSGKNKVNETETYFRLMRWMSGKTPPQ